MLKTMSPSAIERCLAGAAASPMAAGHVDYPAWYLHRWHFLPEGYLSPRSARLYDAVVRRTYNAASEGRLHWALLRHMSRQSPSSVLDVGCGSGHALAAIRRMLPAARLTGIDLSPFLLARAEERIAGEVELVHGDAAGLPWADGTFDAVVTQHALGHMPRAAAVAAWREAARVLRPKGRLYVLEHAWHPRFPVALRRRASRRLLGGFIRLDVFEREDAG